MFTSCSGALVPYGVSELLSVLYELTCRTDGNIRVTFFCSVPGISRGYCSTGHWSGFKDTKGAIGLTGAING